MLTEHDVFEPTKAKIRDLMTSHATYLFAGGGTGGHLFPGIAVAHRLLARDPQAKIVFVGSTRAIEAQIVSESQFQHQMLPVESLTTLKRNPLRFVWQNGRACLQAVRLLKERQPTAVIGLGGFASAPLVWAASRRKIPVILLEQNIIPGRTTRWLSRYANCLCVSFEQTRARFPSACQVVVTGNAVRDEIAALPAGSERVQADQSPVTLRLLILGGSQGAESLNVAVASAMKQLKTGDVRWSIAHQSGPRQTTQLIDAYRDLGITATVEPFFHDMPSQYANADLIVSRAGATTLAELACVGLPMILLPYPRSADDHQRANAQFFVDRGAAIMVEHASPGENTAVSLARALATLALDPERRRSMGVAARGLAQPDAAQKIADAIVQTIGV